VGSIGTATANFLGSTAGSNGGNDDYLWNARFGEGGFDYEFLLFDTDSLVEQAGSLGISVGAKVVADQAWVNSYSSLTSNSHSVQPEMDSPLAKGEQSGIIAVEPNCADESNIGENISSIENRAISIVSFDSRADLSTPRGDGAVSDLDLFQFQQLSLLRLNTVSSFADQFNWLEIIDPFLYFGEQGARVEGDAGHDQQESIQHESSVNSSSATLSRHR
jgi:hypothetical protein